MELNKHEALRLEALKLAASDASASEGSIEQRAKRIVAFVRGFNIEEERVALYQALMNAVRGAVARGFDAADVADRAAFVSACVEIDLRTAMTEAFGAAPKDLLYRTASL